MSDAVNPYQSPETVADPLKSAVSHGMLTENMLVYLKSASPWLRFAGIVGFIGAGGMALWGITSFALGSVTGQIWSSIPGFETFAEASSSVGAAFGFFMGLIIIGSGVLIFIPSLYLYRFGIKIRSYIREGREQDLELAFKNNKSYWKFIGILYIVYLAITPVVMIISITVAIASVVS